MNEQDRETREIELGDAWCQPTIDEPDGVHTGRIGSVTLEDVRSRTGLEPEIRNILIVDQAVDKNVAADFRRIDDVAIGTTAWPDDDVIVCSGRGFLHVQSVHALVANEDRVFHTDEGDVHRIVDLHEPVATTEFAGCVFELVVAVGPLETDRIRTGWPTSIDLEIIEVLSTAEGERDGVIAVLAQQGDVASVAEILEIDRDLCVIRELSIAVAGGPETDVVVAIVARERHVAVVVVGIERDPTVHPGESHGHAVHDHGTGGVVRKERHIERRAVVRGNQRQIVLTRTAFDQDSLFLVQVERTVDEHLQESTTTAGDLNLIDATPTVEERLGERVIHIRAARNSFKIAVIVREQMEDVITRCAGHDKDVLPRTAVERVVISVGVLIPNEEVVTFAAMKDVITVTGKDRV